MLALACTANANICTASANTHTANANIPVIKSDAKIEAKVDQTLKKLTLEEKVGQMMEVVIDLLGANDNDGVFYIDEHKADSIFSHYKVGSILNAPNTCAPTAARNRITDWSRLRETATFAELRFWKPPRNRTRRRRWIGISCTAMPKSKSSDCFTRSESCCLFCSC